MDRRTMLGRTGLGLAGLGLAGAGLMAAPALADAPHGEQPIVIGRSYTLVSPAFGEERRINVWLPPSYGQGEARYPVLYLLDGGEQEDFHHISGLARISGEYGVTREFIVVGVESGSNRRRDMTFPSTDADDLKAIPNNGGSARFRRFLVEAVRPWVEARFRTSGERAIMGESLGGLFVVETLLRQPDAFDAYIAVDPSLWWGKGALVRETALPGWRALAPKRRAYVALSSQGPAAEAGALADGLRAVTDLTYEPMAKETHASIYHPAATRAFRVIFAPPAGPTAP